MVQNAIIIRRTTANASDLKSGALALNNGQWGFATTDKVLVVRDLLGNFYDIPCTDLLPDLLRVKQPVNDVLSFPPGADGDLCLVKSESAYFYSYGNSWRKLADSNQIASLVSEQIALAISAHIAESDPHAQYILGTEIGNTIAPIESGKIPTQYLPSYVDDVLEFASISLFPVVGERDKIYIAIDTNKIYRWGGSSYVEIASGGVALGETSITAYRGDRGKIAFDHSQSTGNPHSTTIADISGLRSELDGKLSSASNPDLVAIEAINGTSGLLIKTAANTWALDTNSYATTTQLTNGSVTKVGTASIGSTTVPVYVNAGTLTACSGTLGVSITGNSATATTATKLGSSTVGSASQPIYLNAGVATAITGTIGNSTTGNAATATKLGTARTIALTGDVTGSASFDGSANASITTTSAHFATNTGVFTPWQTNGSKGNYTGISAPGALRLDFMSHTSQNYAGMYCETDSKWLVLRHANGAMITDYTPSTTSNSTEIATTAFVNSKINQYEFDVTGGNTGSYANWYSKIASWVPSSGVTYFIKFEFDYFGINIYPWDNKPFSCVVTYRDSIWNIYYNKIGSHAAYNRIYAGVTGTTAEIYGCGYGSNIRMVGRMVEQSAVMYSQPTSMTSTQPSYINDLGFAYNVADDSDKIDGKHVVVTAIASKGTDANTLYFCY